MRFDQSTIQQAFAKVPRELADAIVSVDTSEIIFALGRRHNLHIDQLGKLAEEVSYLMLGLTKREEFVKTLAGELGIDELTATAVAKDVNDEILQTIRTEFRERTEAPAGHDEGNRNSELGIRAVNDEAQIPNSQFQVPGGRDALLRELETPTATPISGRRIVQKENESSNDRRLPSVVVSEGGLLPAQDSTLMPATTPPASTPSAPTKPAFDPYREVPA